MDSRFFDTMLENHKILIDLKDSLKDSSENLRNLMELKDEVLYVWNSLENCLVTLNLKYLEEHEKEAPYQKLHLHFPPSFKVERLLAGACGTRICVWGPRGAVIAELPSRWGRSGLFDNGKETVLCKSYGLDERFLHSQGDVRRIHWHPTSLSHILVLLSDNTIRLYNIALKHGPKLVKILNIGPRPHSLLAGKRILDSLGDTAVDFTAVPDTSSLIVLRGNGNVYMISADSDAKSPLPPPLIGPLTMYPPADDNYGEDSCSITIVDGVNKPSVVVIATCSAILYHCLLLPEPATLDESLSDKKDPEYALYVVEAVELNIVLSPDDVNLHYAYPVHLYPSAGNSGTYVCVHAAGVHAVSLPMIAQLKEFMLAEEGDIETDLSSLTSRPSVARYLLCTHGPGAEFSPPVGMAVTAPPLPALLILCSDGRLVSRYLEPFDLEEQLYKELQLKNPALEDEDINKILKERQRLSFTSIIQEILTRDVSQPILNINKKEEPSPQEALEFVTQATVKLRQEYMSRQQRASEAIKKKVQSLRALKRQQIEWHDDLQRDMEEAQQQSMVLREMCALAEKHQDDLKYRCSAVIRALRSNSSATPAERQLLNELQQFQQMKETFLHQIERLKERADLKDKEIQKWQADYKKKDIALGKSHSETISSILQQQTKQISDLIEDTKLLKDQLSIV